MNPSSSVPFRIFSEETDVTGDVSRSEDPFRTLCETVQRVTWDEAAGRELTEKLRSVGEELNRYRSALRAREAQLATSIPVGVDLQSDGLDLARRLEAVLRSATQVTRTHQAAIYLLDDATQFLHLRVCTGLSEQAFLAPPRSLREARADLEALLGHAIVLTTPAQLRQWPVPQVCQSAVCVPISSATTLLGTLWCFSAESQEYTDQQINLVEIIAGRIAAELEREALLHERFGVASCGEVPRHRVSPRTQPIFDHTTHDWELSYRVPHIDGLVPPRIECKELNGRVEVSAVRGMSDARPNGARAPWAGTRGHGIGLEEQRACVQPKFVPCDGQSTFHEFLSTARLEFVESTGQTILQGWGWIQAFAVRPFGWEKCFEASHPGGVADPQLTSQTTRLLLHPRDYLLVVVADRPRLLRIHNGPLLDGPHLAEIVLRHFGLPAGNLLHALWTLFETHPHEWRTLPCLLLLRRTGPTLDADV